MKRFISFEELIDLYVKGRVESTKWGKPIGKDSRTENYITENVIFCFEDYFPLIYKLNYIQLIFKPNTLILGRGEAAYHFYDGWAEAEDAYTTQWYKEIYIRSYTIHDVESIVVNRNVLKAQLHTMCEVKFEPDDSVNPESIFTKIDLSKKWSPPDPHPQREKLAMIYNQILANL